MLSDATSGLRPEAPFSEPLASDTVEAIAPESSEQPLLSLHVETEQATILLIDDEITIVKPLEALLTPRNFIVLSALNGTAGLEVAKYERPDLILLDVMMPDIDGFEVCQRLKEDAETQLIPVVVMTALSGVEDRIKGFEAGSDDFLTKPVNRDELLARIRSSLRLKHTIDQKVAALRQQQQTQASMAQATQTPLYLTISRQGDMLTVDLAAPGSAAVPRGQLPLADHLIDEIDHELTRIITQGVDQAARCPAEAGLPDTLLEDTHTALERLGSLLFAYLLPAPIRQWLATAEPTDLFLRQDDDMLSIPWELVFDGQAFWATKFRIGRQMLSEPSARVGQPRREPRSPLKMLMIVDPSAHKPSSIAEADQLCG